jgi:hypothetical protein
MIKIVVDTNIVVSAYLVPGGKPDKIISLARAGKIDIFLSPQIFKEIERILLSPKLRKIHKTTPEETSRFIEAFKEVIIITPGILEVDVVSDDPDDNKILACAIEGRVDYVVSGDHHLTNLQSFKGIPIINPDMFLKKLSLNNA